MFLLLLQCCQTFPVLHTIFCTNFPRIFPTGLPNKLFAKLKIPVLLIVPTLVIINAPRSSQTHWPSSVLNWSCCDRGTGTAQFQAHASLNFSSSSYLISCCACSKTARSRLPIAFILLISFFLRCFAFHFAFSSLLFREFGTHKGIKEAKRNFHLLKFPIRIWPSPVARVCILRQK